MVYVEPVGTGASGRSTTPADYRLDTYVRFLHAVVEHLGEPRVYLLGHSHGGFVVQRYALAHPDRIAGLALYDTSPVTGAEFWAEAMAGLAAYPQRHPDRPEAAAVPAAFGQIGGATDDESLGAALRAALPVYFADFWGRQDEFAPFQAAVRIWSAPAGAQDPTPFDVRENLGRDHRARRGDRRGVRLHLWPSLGRAVARGASGLAAGRRWSDSGHFAHIEQPVEFTDAVAELLKR